jgi:transposase
MARDEKRKYEEKPIKVRLECLWDLESGMSIRKAAEKYCVAVGTVAGWKQNKLKYQQLVAENGYLD